MIGTLQDHAGVKILELPSTGGPVEAHDIIGEAFSQGADWIALPASRAPAGFFRLRSGVLGEFTQKLVNYGLKLAIIGDVSDHARASKAFSAYLAEASRGADILFVADIAALRARLRRG